MLKFVVVFLCIFRSPHQVWNAPVIKASGVQWTEPKGNGKGNLTLIMIPQNNSCTNETDMLIAVKSDYQVVSQDTQLLNLVIDEHQNDTSKVSQGIENKSLENGAATAISDDCKIMDQVTLSVQSEMLNDKSIDRFVEQKNLAYDPSRIVKVNQDEINVPNISQLSQIHQAADEFNRNTGNNMVNANKAMKGGILIANDIQNMKGGKNIINTHQNSNADSNMVNGNQNSKVGDNLVSAHKNSKVGDNLVNVNQNRKVGDNLVNFNQNRKVDYNSVNVNQNRKVGENSVNVNQNRKVGDNLISANLNSNGDKMNKTEPVSDNSNIKDTNVLKTIENNYLDNITVKGNPNSKSSGSKSYADFLKYMNSFGEAEQHPELDSMKGLNNANYYEGDKKSPERVNEKIKTNGNAENVFKFLSAAQNRETTASVTNNAPEVFKFLKVDEPSHTTSLSTRAFSTVNIYNILNITDNNDVASRSNKNPNSKLFNDNEINIFKELNITEPNIGNKLKKMNEIVTKNSLQNVNPDNSFLNEVVNFFGKAKQGTGKKDPNLRPDSLMRNQAEALVAVDEGDIDTKSKLFKEDNSPAEEEFFKKQFSLFNSNKVGEFKLEGNDNSEQNSGVLTTCYVVNASGDSRAVKNQQETNLQVTSPSPRGAGENEAANNVSSLKGPNPQTGLANPLGGGENTTTVNTNVDRVPPDAPSVSKTSTDAPICRTSIIYICNPQNVSEANENESENVENKPENVKNKPEYIEKQLEKNGNKSGNMNGIQKESENGTQPMIEGSQKKITLKSPIDCVSYLKTKPSLNTTTSVPIMQPDQDSKIKEKTVAGSSMSDVKNISILLNPSSYDVSDVYLSRQDEKLVKFRANPSDQTMSEKTVEDISQKFDGGISKNTKNKISLKNSNSKVNEQAVHPGRVLKMRVSGSNLIVEQMPSYRSEKFEKDCNSTESFETENEALEPDGVETDIRETLKTPKSTVNKMVPTNQTESGGSVPLQDNIQITSEQFNGTGKMKEQEAADQSDKTNRVEVESKLIMTECITVTALKNKNESIFSSSVLVMNEPSTEPYLTTDLLEQDNNKKTKSNNATQEGKETPVTDSEAVSQAEQISRKGSDTGSNNIAESEKPDNPQKNQKNPTENIKIPGNTVKEIVIQIIRNTNKSDNCKVRDDGYGEDSFEEDGISYKSDNFQRPTSKKFSVEKIKSGSYQIKMSNVENDNQEDINNNNLKPQKIESQITSVNEYGVYPLLNENNFLPENFYSGKENNNVGLPVNNGIFQEFDKNEKVPSYCELKLPIEKPEVLNGS